MVGASDGKQPGSSLASYLAKWTDKIPKAVAGATPVKKKAYPTIKKVEIVKKGDAALKVAKDLRASSKGKGKGSS